MPNNILVFVCVSSEAEKRQEEQKTRDSDALCVKREKGKTDP